MNVRTNNGRGWKSEVEEGKWDWRAVKQDKKGRQANGEGPPTTMKEKLCEYPLLHERWSHTWSSSQWTCPPGHLLDSFGSGLFPSPLCSRHCNEQHTCLPRHC